MLAMLADLDGRIAGLDREIARRAREDEAARLLMTVPGIGPVTATALLAIALAPEAFNRGRDFPAWLGLVPRQHSSAGKERLGAITRQGERTLRRLLILGASAVVGSEIGDIHIQDVAVSRCGLPVVAEVTCDIQAGQWLGVIGANGSGKTTLRRAIAGRLPVAAGKLQIGGVDRADDRAWRARHIGFASDGDMIPDALTGDERFDILTDGRSQISASQALGPLRDALGIDYIAHRRIGTSCAGIRQRIAIFCAFVSGQGTVILDEPSIGWTRSRPTTYEPPFVHWSMTASRWLRRYTTC